MFKRFILLLPSICGALAAGGAAIFGADWITGGDADTSRDILTLRESRIVAACTAGLAYFAKSPMPKLLAHVLYGEAPIEPPKEGP